MPEHLPQGTICSYCNKKSNSKGFYCPFCGEKKAKPNSQFIEYDFDLFPQNLKGNTTHNKQKNAYVKKVVIAFSMALLMGAGFLIPYKISERITTQPEYVLELNLEQPEKYKVTDSQTTLDIPETLFFEPEVTKLISSDFDILIEASPQIININNFIKSYANNNIENTIKVPFKNLTDIIQNNTTTIINGDKFVIFSKISNLELGFTIEKLITDDNNFDATIINEYLIVSNSTEYLNDQVDTHKGINKSISKSGYFIDTINVLPTRGEVFIFIKTEQGQEHFINTFGDILPSKNLPLGIIINKEKMYYVDFAF